MAYVTVISVARFQTTAEVDAGLLEKPDELAAVVKSKASNFLSSDRSEIPVRVSGRPASGPGVTAEVVEIRQDDKSLWSK